ncbi:MAG: ABC transporter permease [Ruminococcaceae bacterium]|jgi:spermidine/putrescine transport system permease protein|nr:ABC transporter permease [Oscillospiraceae bacterium]
MKTANRWWLCIAPLYAFSLVFVLGPVLYMIVISFAENEAGTGFRWAFTLENFSRMRDPLYVQCFRESLRLALSTTVLNVLIGYPFGYYMGRLGAKGKRRMMFLLMVPFWTSSLIRLYGWIILLQAKGVLNNLLLSLGVIRMPLKILYSYPAVLIGMVYGLLPFMILAVYSSVEKMDWTLVEAARDLGASPLKAFLTVTLRLTLPGLMSGVILTFVPSMGLFFIADLLGGNKIVLVGSLIQDQMTRGGNQPFAAALALVLAAMTTVLLWLYRRLTGTTELEGML